RGKTPKQHKGYDPQGDREILFPLCALVISERVCRMDDTRLEARCASSLHSHHNGEAQGNDGAGTLPCCHAPRAGERVSVGSGGAEQVGSLSIYLSASW